MSYKDITAGEKIAKPLAMRYIRAPKTGTMGVEVKFQFTEPSTGIPETLYWQGWLSSKAEKFTHDTLIDVLKVQDDALNFDPETEVKLVVELESYEKDGKKLLSPKVKFVNSLGGSNYDALTPEVIKSSVEIQAFKFALLSKGRKPAQKSVNPDEIPF